MKGKIIKIRENYRGQEYGFIMSLSSDESEYYFDNRYLKDGTMADFYQDDIVIFDPYTNPYKKNQKIAINVVLDLEATNQYAVAHNEEQANIVTDSNTSQKDNSKISKNWYRLNPPSEKIKTIVENEFSREEQIIIRKFWDILYPTNVGHFRIKDNDVNFGYHLFGPTMNFFLQLGLEKNEFAVLFNDRKSFQRKTLEEPFFYLTHSLFSRVRISGYFFVLLTKYDDIEHQVQLLEERGALPYSIIPFTYKELLNEPDSSFENFVLERFKSHLFERNFFSYSEPINDQLFLFGGREVYAKGIVDRCASGDHSGVFGLRKSGKTSVLNMIKQELEHRNIIYQSYHCANLLNLDWHELLYTMVNDIYKKRGMRLTSQEYSKKNAASSFANDINIISEKAEATIVFLFDEIEQISPDTTFEPLWRNPTCYLFFWHTIISYCEENPGKLSIVVAGINPSINEEYFVLSTEEKSNPTKAAPRNPIYLKLSNDSYLKPFTFEQTSRMVNELGRYMGLHFSDEVCYELQKDFGGHPFFTRQMCKLIVEHIKQERLKKQNVSIFEISRQLYNAVKDSAIYEMKAEGWCDDVLKELRISYPQEYRDLLQIANGDKIAKTKVKENIKTIPHLTGYGLVRCDPASREMEISIDIVRDYLIARKEYKKPFSEMSVEEIDNEISAGISACERPLRDMIANVLLNVYDEKQAADFIRETPSIRKENKGIDISEYTVQQLLDPSQVKIHLYTLKDIIVNNNHFAVFRDRLSPYSSREIRQFLDNIYISRTAADHHFEEYHEATLETFRASLKAILGLLK